MLAHTRSCPCLQRSDVMCMHHAGSCHGSSLVVMSKGTRYTQQSYKVSDAFPFEWIKKKWKENFYITSMATAGAHPRPLASCGSLLCLRICMHIHCSSHKATSCSLWVRAYFLETCCCKQANKQCMRPGGARRALLTCTAWCHRQAMGSSHEQM